MVHESRILGKPPYLKYEGDEYVLSLKSNPFVYRFKDETLLKDKAGNKKRFYILKGLSNVSQGISVMLGGAVAESARQSISENESSGSWQLDEVDQKQYQLQCADK